MQFLITYSRFPFCDDRIVLHSTRVGLLVLKLVGPLRCWQAFASKNEKVFGHLLEHDTDRVRQCLSKHNARCARIEKLSREKDAAGSLYEYEGITTQLDEEQNHNEWKDARESIEPDYKPEVIEAEIVRLSTAIASREPCRINAALSGGIARNLGGMGSIRLYKHSWFGTKKLVNTYNTTVIQAINNVVQSAFLPGTTQRDVVQFRRTLIEAAESYGRTALSLSGGALLGMKHIGVCKTLWECDLLPNIISGTSAGSIVAAIVATRTDEEMETTLQHFPESNLAVFDPRGATPGIPHWCCRRLSTFYERGTWFNPHHLQVVVREWLGELTFLEGFNKTRRILNITVSRVSSAAPTLLNYRTTPNVLIWSAVCASCAVPFGVFPAATIYEKVPGSSRGKAWVQDAISESEVKWVDGSLDHDIPMRQLHELFNAKCSIVSQMNPHVRPFLVSEEQFNGEQPKQAKPAIHYRERLKTATHTAFSNMEQWATHNSLRIPVWRLLMQKYTGDINIFPDYTWGELATMVANPTAEYMMNATRDGERATWPKICRIKNAVAIELALERGIRTLTERLHFPESDMELAQRVLRPEQRGRSGFRGSSTEPHFLRSRSVGYRGPENTDRRKRRRRASSDGTVNGLTRPQILASLLSPTRSQTLPILAPQTGVNGLTLMMTPIEPADPGESGAC